jgi:hypothetical protein
MSSSPQPARLVLQQPSGESLVYSLEHGRSLTIGRDASNAVALPSQFVSKRHALLSWTARGVRIEDQDSANGLSVNGLTVHAAQLSGGDVIQIGDQTLVFETDNQTASAMPAPRHAPAAPPNKGLRLLVVAMLTMLVLVGGLSAVYVLLLAPAAEDTQIRAARTTRANTALPDDTVITPFDSPQAQAIAAQAETAKTNPVDWIYDEGLLAFRSGRLLESYRLLHGVLHRDPAHEAARRELLRVMGEREMRLQGYQAAASRAEQELKFDDAARQWEQVLAMTLDNESLHTHARAEAARLHARAGGR